MAPRRYRITDRGVARIQASPTDAIGQILIVISDSVSVGALESDVLNIVRAQFERVRLLSADANHVRGHGADLAQWIAVYSDAVGAFKAHIAVALGNRYIELCETGLSMREVGRALDAITEV